MKSGISQDTRQGKYNRYPQQSLSVKDALTWFIITVIALCVAGKAQANVKYHYRDVVTAPIAYDITMTPMVQAAAILPFDANAGNGTISSYTINTIPAAWQGILSISMNGILVPVSEGMMITPDLAGNLVFAPDSSFNGNAVFTYSAGDEEGLISNIATYTIPVIGKQQGALPISLLNFTATENNKIVQLHWQTENENNFSYFEIQRSANGIQFETIATETAQGNRKNNYYNSDDLFFISLHSVYYRLKMVNINGSFKYSSIIRIQPGAAVVNQVKAWPLPFTSTLNIAFNSNAKETVKITLRSVTGAEVMQMTSTAVKGLNTIAIYQAQTIPAGTYLLTISGRNKAETIKVIK